MKLLRKLTNTTHALMASAAWADSGVTDVKSAISQRKYRRLIFRLMALVLALFLLVGAVHNWRAGDGRDSLLADLLWHTVWVSYSLARLALVALLLLAAYAFFESRGKSNRT
jgi:hypothetical protein